MIFTGRVLHDAVKDGLGFLQPEGNEDYDGHDFLFYDYDGHMNYYPVSTSPLDKKSAKFVGEAHQNYDESLSRQNGLLLHNNNEDHSRNNAHTSTENN